MNTLVLALVAVVLALGGAEAQMKDAWQSGSTGRGTARWDVAERQLVYRGGADFGWAVNGAAVQDGFVEVRFRPLEGRTDQAGGVVWRWQDANNYYIARANALEDNVHFFRVVGGRRQELAGADTKVASGVWHTLTLRAEGNRLSVSFNGKLLFTHTDRTFAAPGKIALWTKADSVTRFDWIEIKPLKEK